MTHPALVGRRLAAVDLEGNGGSPIEIVELAVLPMDGGVVADEAATWLVRPVQRIRGLVTRMVHGISNADVAECPPWSEVADEVTAALADRALIGHAATGEHRILSRQLPHWRPPMVLDTLRLAKHVWPGLPTYALHPLLAHAGLDTPEGVKAHGHRAAYDARMTARLFLTLLAQSDLDWPGLVEVAAPPRFLEEIAAGG